jgi:hypothetical protein
MKKILLTTAIIGLLFTACEKKVSPVDGSRATIELANLGDKYITQNITVNPKDSIFFSYSVNSPVDMKFVSIQKNPVNHTAFLVRDTLTAANKNSYSAVKKFAADSVNGDWLYRIVAHDAAGVYIGHKDIKVTVNSDYNYYTYRFLQVPDTTAKTNTCFLAATTGSVYSLTTGGANSALIDMGFYYDTTTANKFSLFALSAPQPQLAYYDIASWTKNATIMKKATSPAFNTLLSAGGLRAAGILNLASGTANKITALAAGNLVFFRTASGKNGCLQINYINGADGSKASYANVDVKIEK